MKALYYMAPIDAAEQIQNDGISPDGTGEIWLFENKSVSGYIKTIRVTFRMEAIEATRRGLKKYALFRVHGAGINSRLKSANMPETNPTRVPTFNHLWILRQERINPKHIELISKVTWL